jgi:hypothetical protein
MLFTHSGPAAVIKLTLHIGVDKVKLMVVISRCRIVCKKLRKMNVL